MLHFSLSGLLIGSRTSDHFIFISFHFKKIYCQSQWCQGIFKGKTVHTFNLTFSSSFVRIVYYICLFFSPIGVTRADNHVTGYPWGLVTWISKMFCIWIGLKNIVLHKWVNFNKAHNQNSILKNRLFCFWFFSNVCPVYVSAHKYCQYFNTPVNVML